LISLVGFLLLFYTLASWLNLLLFYTFASWLNLPITITIIRLVTKTQHSG
jgi:hypothetical protein